MVKGGYQIINLDGVAHNVGSGVTHEGIYERIDGTQKPIMLSGLNVGGTDYHDSYVTPIVVGSNYVIEVYDFKITINANDSVIVNIKESSAIATYALDAHLVSGSNVVSAEDYQKLKTIISGANFAELIFYYDERLKNEYTIGFDVNDNSLFTANFNIRTLAEPNIEVSQR